MDKYISTFVDDKPTCLKLNSCNLCPYLKIDAINKKSYCLKNSNTISKLRSYTYEYGYHRPILKIDIPIWCHLSSDFFNCLTEKYVYFYKYGEVVKKEIVCINKNFLNDIDVKYSINRLIRKKSNNTDIINNIIETNNTCSCCGKSKNNVNRDINMGMCKDCNDVFTNDKKYFIYINNFRLKRKSEYLNKKFKKAF